MGLKPMNCPGHCLIFGSGYPSYRDLPMRLADFGVLHRNELSGALTGLTRVRRFQQDDAHIFCAEHQIENEIEACLKFVERVYSIFGFQFSIRLSTRPQKFIGDIALWDKAENALKDCLNKFGHEWELNEGDGAFYGPKIDIEVTDALRRSHQCATIQLDFNLPKRFGLKFQGDDDRMHTPVLIHRAVLGSVERMMAILIEHTGGKWPFWLSPRQCMICPVDERHVPYAREVQAKLLGETGSVQDNNKRFRNDFFVDLDERVKARLPKRIKEAQQKQYNYVLVVGDVELGQSKVNVRTRDGVVHGLKSIEEVVSEWQNLVATFK